MGFIYVIASTRCWFKHAIPGATFKAGHQFWTGNLPAVTICSQSVLVSMSGCECSSLSACPALSPAPANGALVPSTGVNEGDVVSVQCDAGYSIGAGPASYTCPPEGLWNGVSMITTCVHTPNTGSTRFSHSVSSHEPLRACESPDMFLRMLSFCGLYSCAALRMAATCIFGIMYRKA